MNSSTSATSVRPATKLNEPNIKSAAPGDVLRDEDVHGLHMRVFPTKKVFYLYFRTKTGQERRPKLGNHGQITLTQARTAAKLMLAEVASGGDPIAIREGARNEPTMEDLWNEYWKRHGSDKDSGKEDQRMWNAYIKPRFARCKLSTISFTDMDDFHKTMAPIQANRVIAMLSKMFNYAHRPLEWFNGSNPCKGVKRNKETKRRRYGSKEEVQRLLLRLRQELEGKNANSAAFIWLLLFTGARKGEIASTRWDNVHGNRILLDKHKTDDGGFARIIYLPPAAKDIIDRYLKVSSKTLTGILDPKKFWDNVRTEEGMPDLRMHDLRRTFASFAISAGASLEQTMQMLGQTNAQTAKIYAWLMEDAHEDVVSQTADAIMG